MSRKFARCLGVASESRQDQARGTLMTRPSASCAMISSSVTRTVWMRGSLLPAVFMPYLQNFAAPRTDDSANHVQFVGAETMTSRQFDRFEPEFAGATPPLHMDVRRLIAVEAREEEPVRSRDVLDPWHS